MRRDASTAETCFLCGSTSFRELLSITAPDRFETHVGVSPEGYRRAWEECLGCGLTHNRYPEGVLEKLDVLCESYYEVDFSGSSIADKYGKVMGLPPAKSDNAQRVARVISFWQEYVGFLHAGESSFRALDIGAGTGVFLSRFLAEAGAGWSGVGMEPDPRACDHLRSLGNFAVRQEPFTGQADLTGFHLCTFNKVLEHIRDPLGVLRSVSGALAETGLLYLEVPDKSTCLYRPPNDNILGALHHHLYDVGSLARLMRAAGFDVLSSAKVFDPSGKISVAAFGTRPEGAARLSRREAPR